MTLENEKVKAGRLAFEKGLHDLRAGLAAFDWKVANQMTSQLQMLASDVSKDTVRRTEVSDKMDTDEYLDDEEPTGADLVRDFECAVKAGRLLYRLTSSLVQRSSVQLMSYDAHDLSIELESDPFTLKLHSFIRTHQIQYLNPIDLQLSLAESPGWLFQALLPFADRESSKIDRRSLMMEVPGWLNQKNELILTLQDCGARNELLNVKIGLNWILGMILAGRIEKGSPITAPVNEHILATMLRANSKFDYAAAMRIVAAIDELWPFHKTLTLGHIAHIYDRFSQRTNNVDTHHLIKLLGKSYQQNAKSLTEELQQSRLNGACADIGNVVPAAVRYFVQIGFRIGDNFELFLDSEAVVRLYKIPRRFAEKSYIFGEYVAYRYDIGPNWASENEEINNQVRDVCRAAISRKLLGKKSVLSLVDEMAKSGRWGSSKRLLITRRVFLAFRKIGYEKGRLSWDQVLDHLGYVDEDKKGAAHLPLKSSCRKSLTDVALTATIVKDPRPEELFGDGIAMLDACTRWAISERDERSF